MQFLHMQIIQLNAYVAYSLHYPTLGIFTNAYTMAFSTQWPTHTLYSDEQQEFSTQYIRWHCLLTKIVR